MDGIIACLRHSAVNDDRAAASAALRHLQETSADEFLTFVWVRVSSPASAYSEEDRFFLGSLLLSFAEESWRNYSDAAARGSLLHQYVQLVLNGEFSDLLCRKFGEVIACMARQSPKAADLVSLPPHIDLVVNQYLDALYKASSASMMHQMSKVMLLIHLLLKQVQTKRIGKVFEKLCALLDQPLLSTMHLPGFGSLATADESSFTLRTLKCAYRVFGCGILSPTFACFLLEEAWKLSSRLAPEDPSSRVASRLMDYILKVFNKMVVYFPSHLQSLGCDFFVCSNPEWVGTSADRSLLYFVYAIIIEGTRRSAGTLSEKAACRAMSILTVSLAAEEADPFVNEYLARFSHSSLLPRMIHTIIVSFLADDCSSDVKDSWGTSPELALEELDVEYDDESSAISCAEQLFLALTSSSESTVCLQAAWGAVNSLLTQGNESEVTAALHAIGVGYFTMAHDQDPSSYLDFLHQKLLPLLWSSIGQSGPPPSEFVLRRVVWLIGMWCESVVSVENRREIYSALENMLLRHQSVVIRLTALRSISNFISDDQFTLSELPLSTLEAVVTSIQQVLPLLQSTTVVKEVVNLLYLLIEKNALPSQGDAVISVLLPPTRDFINRFTFAHQSDNNDEELDSSLLTTLLECLTSAVKVSSLPNQSLNELFAVVVECTNCDGVLYPYVEEDGWELLLAIGQSAAMHTEVGEKALNWAARNSSRDFVALPTVFQCLSAFMILRAQAAEDVISMDHVGNWTQVLCQTVSTDATTSLVSLFLSIVALSRGPLRSLIAQLTLREFAGWQGTVQGDTAPIQLALILAACLKDSQCQCDLQPILQGAMIEAGASGHGMVENLLLLLDVSPNIAYDCALQYFLAHLATHCEIPAQDLSAVKLALSQSSDDMSSTDPLEVRQAMAVLDIAAPGLTLECPYYLRVKNIIAPLLFS